MTPVLQIRVSVRISAGQLRNSTLFLLMMLNFFSLSLQVVVAVFHSRRVCLRMKPTRSQEMEGERFLVTSLKYLDPTMLGRYPWSFG